MAFPDLQIDYQDLIILENKPSTEFTTFLFQTRMWLRFWVCLNIVSKCNDCASNTSCLLPTAPAHPDNSGRHATPLFVPYRSTLFADVPNHRQSLFSTHHHQLCSPGYWRRENSIWECSQGGRLCAEFWLSWDCNVARQTDRQCAMFLSVPQCDMHSSVPGWSQLILKLDPKVTRSSVHVCSACRL